MDQFQFVRSERLDQLVLNYWLTVVAIAFAFAFWVWAKGFAGRKIACVLVLPAILLEAGLIFIRLPDRLHRARNWISGELAEISIGNPWPGFIVANEIVNELIAAHAYAANLLALTIAAVVFAGGNDAKNQWMLRYPAFFIFGLAAALLTLYLHVFFAVSEMSAMPSDAVVRLKISGVVLNG